MKIISYYINIEKLRDAVLDILSCENVDETMILNDIEAKVDSSQESIRGFLQLADAVEDENLQKSYRKAAIAQMYNVRIDCSSIHPYISEIGKSVAIISFPPKSSSIGKWNSAVVSKYGDIIIDEGEIQVLTQANYGFGWLVENVTDRKLGFISNSGSSILPCVFDDVDMHIGEYNFIFRKLCFRLIIHGELKALENKETQNIIDEDDFYFVSEDTLLGLQSQEYMEPHFYAGKTAVFDDSDDGKVNEIKAELYSLLSLSLKRLSKQQDLLDILNTEFSAN